MNTIWLLDFDGVVNVIGRKPPRWPGPMGKDAALGFPLRWAPPLVDAINAIHASGKAEVRWATTWLLGDSVADITRITGLGPFPAAFPVSKSIDFHDAKRAAAKDVVAAGNRLVWTDDDAIPARKIDLIDLLGDDDGSYLAVRPPETRGLSTSDVDRILAFL